MVKGYPRIWQDLHQQFKVILLIKFLLPRLLQEEQSNHLLKFYLVLDHGSKMFLSQQFLWRCKQINHIVIIDYLRQFSE